MNVSARGRVLQALDSGEHGPSISLSRAATHQPVHEAGVLGVVVHDADATLECVRAYRDVLGCLVLRDVEQAGNAKGRAALLPGPVPDVAEGAVLGHVRLMPGAILPKRQLRAFGE